MIKRKKYIVNGRWYSKELGSNVVGLIKPYKIKKNTYRVSFKRLKIDNISPNDKLILTVCSLNTIKKTKGLLYKIEARYLNSKHIVVERIPRSVLNNGFFILNVRKRSITGY